MANTNQEVLTKVDERYNNLFKHNGFGEMRVEMKIIKNGQKEIILHCGKQTWGLGHAVSKVCN